ncbi:uncharacterized protein LOC133829933 [Humulus lupulus]|uniref:uncharacterized protein LOC133829933 n=1 Tax=Humulus lupulus TaxID=3486 RepID=UPI002B404CB3|nr:uncharacterized protein LOC133829933 [Humulus lupulus]
MVEEINVINLESLKLKGVSLNKKSLSACKAIRNLSLTCWDMEDSSSLEYLISNLPLLEDLAFSNGRNWALKHIKISSKHLKRVIVTNPFDNEMTVIIKSAPNLASLYYVGNIKFSVSMEPSNLLNGTFVILKQQENYDTDWFINLMNFLLNLNCSWNKIRLHVDSVEALILPKYLKRICRSPLVTLNHLRVFTECKPEKEKELVLKDVLRWISPSLKTLFIGEKGPLLKSLQKAAYLFV